VRPFFFGETAEPLLGLHHPPAGARTRPSAVAILNPFGDEYSRAHRSLRQLADRVSAAGFHVLRFDYFGCGDSAGADDQGRLARWLEDAAAALEELEALSGASRMALVGLRLGGSLAVELARRRQGIEQLALWDPVARGQVYLQELEAAHATFLRENARRARAVESEPPQVLGYPLPPALRAEIEAVDLTGCASPPARHTLLLTTGSDQRTTVFPAGPPPGGSLERERMAGSAAWQRDTDAMASALVAVDALERITRWLDRRCP